MGQKIDPVALYKPVSSFASITAAGHFDAHPSQRMLGSSQVVTLFSSRFVPADTDDGTVAQLLRRESMPESPDPLRTQIIGQIPPERRRIATRNYHDATGMMIEAGKVYDSASEFVHHDDSGLFERPGTDR